MRIPGLRRTGFAALLLAPLLAVSAAGCAKRLPLTEKELERVKTEAGIQPLRVYVGKRVWAISKEANVKQDYSVQKRIQESSSGAELKSLTNRDTSGLILKIDEINGAPALWVTFEPEYDKPEDAMIFVQGNDGTFRLHSVPTRAGYEDPRVFRGVKWKSRKMKAGKMASLAEPNDVLLVKKGNGKILTVELQVKKIIDNRTRSKTRRAKGID
jgi:hypothetical protein